MSLKKQKIYRFGILAEKIALIFLILKGYKIMNWRYKTKLGEIDIIAKKANLIVLIEVKARSSKSNVEEVLTNHQINRIKSAAQIFLSKNPQFQDHDLRFDFIEVSKFLLPKHYSNFIS